MDLAMYLHMYCLWSTVLLRSVFPRRQVGNRLILELGPNPRKSMDQNQQIPNNIKRGRVFHFAGMIAISYILAGLLIPLEPCLSVRSLLRGAFDTGLGAVLARGRIFESVEVLYSFFLLRNYINFLFASLWF
jgi:hypothetical protein